MGHDYDGGWKAMREAEAAEAWASEREGLRDQFAMVALNGLLASGDQGTSEMLSIEAYMLADAMLSAREVV